MTKPADLLRRQIETNNSAIAELRAITTNLQNEIAENNETVIIIEAANKELEIAIAKLEENT
jgi:hypothetical protein